MEHSNPPSKCRRIAKYAASLEGDVFHLNYCRISFFSVAYSKGEMLVWLGEKWEMPIVIIVHIVIFALFGYLGIE